MSEFKPVAWLLMDGTIISEYSYNLRKLKEDGDIPLFTQRTWVGLTDGEIDQGLLRSDYAFKTAEAWRAGVVFAMTKLKQKNGYDS